ncbi:hypothetical protein CAPTEDRAFT_87079, partial [Capitella teleta]
HDTFQCRDGSCILVSHVCDGESDCLDGEDEICGHLCSFGEFQPFLSCIRDCYPHNCTCSETHFQCLTGKCIPFEKVCDGISDCNDSSDEHGWATCPDEFKCHHSYCIPIHRVCDGIYDCPMKDDERDCADLSCVGLFKCKNGTCLHPSFLCNGKVDCPLYADDE